MLPAVVGFFTENHGALLFYAIVILLIVAFRRKIEWQAFAIGLYKTKIGLKLMESWGKKHKGLVQILGYVGIGVGFVGMLFIMFILLKGFFDMLVDPSAPPVVSPVIPGFSIWGHDLKVPLITGWLALFVVIVIHEFSHGVVSKAHGVKVKSSGLLVFGPILGAFVEPDEKRLPKEDPSVQYALFAAGPWSNVLSAGIFMLLAAYIVAPLVLAMTAPAGVEIASVIDGYPAEGILAEGTIITNVNGNEIGTYADMSAVLSSIAPGEEVQIATREDTVTLIAAEHPEEPGKGYLGVTLTNKRDPRNGGMAFALLLGVLVWLQDFLSWVVILSLGIGLANLLPIGPIDGGRMIQTACRQILGNEKRGDWWWKKISMVTLVLLLILLLVPIVRAVV